MILEPKHKNFAGPSEIKETVKKIFNIRRHMSTPRAFKCYFKIILNWWYSPFKWDKFKKIYVTPKICFKVRKVPGIWLFTVPTIKSEF
jgi:hypothetical protein